MGAALIELEAKLRASQGLTLDESRVFDTCKTKALKNFLYGSVLGWGLTFIATWKLKTSLQFNLACGTGLLAGARGFSRSLDSCVKDIVSQDGTRMQLELTNILVNKYPNNSWVMQVISKHFYTEKVYDDSTSDLPKLRLRYRSYFSDNITLGQKTHDHEDDQNADNSPENSNNSVPRDTTGRRTTSISRQSPVNAGLSTMTDPVNDIFGFTETLDESNRTSTSSTQTKGHNRAHKRSRRRRQRHKENSMESVDELAPQVG